MKTYKELIQEWQDFYGTGLDEALSRSLSHVADYVKSRNIGIISASRAELKPEQNNKRTGELESDLSKSGFGYTRIRGYSREEGREPVEERSFLVVGCQGKNED